MPSLLTAFQSLIEFDNEIFSDLRVTFGISFQGLGVPEMGKPYHKEPEELHPRMFGGLLGGLGVTSKLCYQEPQELPAKRRWLRKVLLRLALEFDTLPSSMTVQVVDISEDIIYSGGLVDVFTARCNGKAVALKRFRVRQEDLTTEKTRVPCHSMTPTVKSH